MAIKKDNQNVINISIGLILVLAIMFGTNPPTRNALLTYLVFLGAIVFVYRLPRFQNLLIGIGRKNLGRSIFFGLVFGGIYFAITKFIPGLSLGLPLLPGSIGGGLTIFIIVIIAPIVEEIFFRGSLLAYIRNFNPSKKKINFAIVLQGLLFGLAHVGAYVSGFYNYPTLPAGLSALGQNLGAFVSASAFGMLAGWFVSKDGIHNLVFSILFHMILNAIILGLLSIAVI